MKKYTIVICKGCGKKFRIYSFQAYEGDPEYCRECNDESKEKPQKVKYETT